MFIVGPYLFSGDELDGWLKARHEAALEAARGGDDGAAGGAERVREIYDRFQVPETALHPEGAVFAEERPLNDEECEAIGVRDEDRATFKAVTIAVPYTGDAHLLTCRPAIYSAHQPQAEVGDDELRITWFLSDAEEMQLEHNFKRTIALIDRTLEVTQWQAMGFNQELMEALKSALMGRQAG